MLAAFADDPANLIRLLCVYQSVEKTIAESVKKVVKLSVSIR
jgi:hypothetical protein